MRRLNALIAGLAGAALAPLAGLADYGVIADGALRPTMHAGALAVFLLVLSIAGFSAGVLFAALWNTAFRGQ